MRNSPLCETGLDLPDACATLALGTRLAGLLRTGDVIALHGDLGAGKTTLARGLITALAGPGTEVTSPTFLLLNSYETPGLLLHHLDLYRLDSAGELVEIGWSELRDGVMLVEWPERAGRFLPAERLDVFLDVAGSGRRARLCARGEAWHDRLSAMEPA